MRAKFVLLAFQREKAFPRALIYCGFAGSVGARGVWIECVNEVLMLHNSLVSGDCVNCFYHTCIGMSEQVGKRREILVDFTCILAYSLCVKANRFTMQPRKGG